MSEDEDPIADVKKGKGNAVATPIGLLSPAQIRQSSLTYSIEGPGRSSNPIDLDSDEANLRTPVGRNGEMSPGRRHL